MPVYHFDQMKGNVLIKDDEGQDLPDIEAAKIEALESARELLAAAVRRGIYSTNRAYIIRTADGEILATLPFRDVIKEN
jgi:hypothetical protein